MAQINFWKKQKQKQKTFLDHWWIMEFICVSEKQLKKNSYSWRRKLGLCWTQILNIRQTLLSLKFNPSCETYKTDRSCIPTKANFTLPAGSHAFPASSFIFSSLTFNIRTLSYNIAKEISVTPLVSTSLQSSWLMLKKLLREDGFPISTSKFKSLPSSLPFSTNYQKWSLCQQASFHFHAFPSLLPQTLTDKFIRGASSTNPQLVSRQAWCFAFLLSDALSPYSSIFQLHKNIQTRGPPVRSRKHKKCANRKCVKRIIRK